MVDDVPLGKVDIVFFTSTTLCHPHSYKSKLELD